MKLFYYKGDIPNFGDELNPWLWDRFLPEFFDDDDDTMFLGMGSILWNDHPQPPFKVVVGTGYGGYTDPPDIDDRWKFYFVRGPRTAARLNLAPELAIGDPAMLISMLAETSALPRGVSGPAFMPHWETARDGVWPQICAFAGVRFIDPRWDVERVLREIAASTVLVSEAMHGAIVADALRVPFIPFLPNPRHHFKWHDWADSLGFPLHFAEPAPSGWVEAALRTFEGNRDMERRIHHYSNKYRLSFANALFRSRAVTALRNALRLSPNLSSDEALFGCTTRILDRLAQLRQDYPAAEICRGT